MREIRYRDGTTRHIYAGPAHRRRRPPTWALFIAAGLCAVWLANHGVI